MKTVSKKKSKEITAKEIDRRFDAGESVLEHFDRSSRERPHQQPRVVNVSLPVWMIRALDHEAERLFVARQAVMKTILAEGLAAREKQKP